MSNGARVSDAVSHGGVIGTGSTDVLTEGLPTARLADLVVCAVHGVAVIAGSSATVLVNERGFARKGDGCICAGSGTAGPGARELVLFILSVHGSGKTLEEIIAETNGHGPHLQALASDANRDGVLDTLKIDGGLMGFRLGGQPGDPGVFGMEVGSVSGEAAFIRNPNAAPMVINGIPLNATARLKGEATALRGELGANFGDAGSIRGTGKLFTASTDNELMLLDDGRRRGVVARGGGKVAAVSGKADATVNTSLNGVMSGLSMVMPTMGPLAIGGRLLSSMSPSAREVLETPIKIEASLGGSAASAGLEGGFEAYHDRVSQQVVVGVDGEVAALLGLGIDLKITAGEDQSASADQPGGGAATGAGGPNVIVGGAGTVLVGG